MSCASISELRTKFSAGAIKSTRLVVLLLVAAFMSVTPARAQSADTWKSIAIIGGSTAAGAYIGHKVGGRTGAYVGAAAGATAGYAIDRRRRQNQNYNNDYQYGNDGYYGDNGGYYGNNYPYAGNGGYDSDSRNTSPYSSGYQSNSFVNNKHHGSRRR
jgi:hypothetical protein